MLRGVGSVATYRTECVLDRGILVICEISTLGRKGLQRVVPSAPRPEHNVCAVAAIKQHTHRAVESPPGRLTHTHTHLRSAVTLIWRSAYAFPLQTDVPHGARLLHRTAAPLPAARSLRGAAGRGADGLAPLPLRVPSLLVAGGGQSGSAAAGPAVRASGQSDRLRGAAQASGFVREGEADQQ